MPKLWKGDDEHAMFQKRKKLTEEGFPEYARTARDYTDPDQVIKTATKLRELQDKRKRYF